MIVAWDIETCPLPIRAMRDPQRRRFALDYRREAMKDRARSVGEIAAKVGALNPFLGWVCCISVVAGDTAAAPRTPKSYTAADPALEGDLLRRFWADVAKLPKTPTWVSFNGKQFDAEFLMTRSLRHHVQPTRTDLLDRNRWKFFPHCDLAGLWQSQRPGLADLCDLLSLPSPKEGEVSGGSVWRAVQLGQIAEVAAYCERDVLATLAAYALLQGVIF